jgi:hypothetical protein
MDAAATHDLRCLFHLAVLAKQHPLSFKAALMLFEEDDKRFHELF